MKRRRRWGKDGDERRITKKSGSVQKLPSPAHPSALASLGSPRIGLSLPELPPTPAEPLPAATGQRKSPAARPDPARRRRATLPAPGAAGAAPGPLARRSPTTTITSPLLRGRTVTSPPATSHAPQAESQHPAASRTRTLGRETMNRHNSPAAPELRGSGGGSFAPSPSPSPPPRSGIRPPGAEPPPPLAAREPSPPPDRRPRSLPEESHFIPRSNMAAPPAAAAAAAAFSSPRLPAAATGERPQAVLGSRPAGRWRCRERQPSRAAGVCEEGASRAGLRVPAAG